MKFMLTQAVRCNDFVGYISTRYVDYDGMADALDFFVAPNPPSPLPRNVRKVCYLVVELQSGKPILCHEEDITPIVG